MLSGGQLGVAISAVLALAVATGWVLHWVWLRLSNAAVTDTERMTEMVNRMHEADHAREIAEEAQAIAETMLAAREAEMEVRLAEMQARLDGAIQGREAELAQALREAQADAEASMAGLRNARRRIMELEAEVEELRGSKL